MTEKFIVIKRGSPTSQSTTWKILSRELATKQSASDWADFMKTLKTHKRTKNRIEVLTILRDETTN